MARSSDVIAKARVLGLGVSITSPGDGRSRYDIFVPAPGNLQGRTLILASGAKEAMTFLRGYGEGVTRDASSWRTRGSGRLLDISD